MLFTPEERRALLALITLLLLGQGVSYWEEQRRSKPDRQLSAWLTRLACVRGDTTALATAALGGIPGALALPLSNSASEDKPELPEVPVEPLAAVPPGILETGRVRINQAGARDLESLPGVGPALAGRILAERERNGPFRRAEDLLRVSGIGPKKLAALRDRIDWDSGPPPPAERDGTGPVP